MGRENEHFPKEDTQMFNRYMKKRANCHLLLGMGMSSSSTSTESNMNSQKSLTRIPIWPSNTTYYLCPKYKTLILKDICTLMFIAILSTMERYGKKPNA